MTPEAFYTERIPAQFNRALDLAREAQPACEGLIESLSAVNAAMRVVVAGKDGGTFHLNINQGRMSADDEITQPLLLTLHHDLAAFSALAKQAGDSALGFLGGMAGMPGEIRLTKERVGNLKDIEGSISFALLGDEGFEIVTHFGEAALPERPTCSISLEEDAYIALRSGELSAQEAFMTGQIRVEGNMQMAMQLALAMMNPDG